MRTFLSVMLVSGALLCTAAFAQSEPPSAQNPSAPAAQPQAQPATSSQTQPEAQPQSSHPAQSGQAPSTAGQATTKLRIAPGSVIPVQLTKTVDAKKAKTGDPIVAKVTMDMTTSTGEVLVPKDTKVMGHITEAQARTKEQKESQLGIAFDHAILKDGTQIPVSFAIQAISNSRAAASAAAADDLSELATMLYFSLTTLTTTGYGDIVPVDPFARSLANLESLLGLFYLAITIAPLVTLEVEDRRR